MKLKKSITDLTDIQGKKVLIRVDFNVPIEKGEITNDYRIRSTMPTIREVMDKGAGVILMSHLGRPEGIKYDETKPEAGKEVAVQEAMHSLLPVAKRLEEILKSEDPDALPVLFAEDCMNAQEYVDQLKPKQALLLENVRFYKNEGSKKEEERAVMAKKLASYGDVFVSDAFGTAHRNAATMTGIPQVLGQGVAGFLMAKEIKAFSQVLNDPPRPLVAIVGGSKVSDKILLLENMITKINRLVIGGAMAYTFLKAQGYEIGKSFSQAGQMFKDKDGNEMDIVDLAKKLLEQAKEKGVEVSLPVDHVCHTSFAEPEGGAEPLVTTDQNIPADYMALDIGPKTIEQYKEIVRECKAAIWNGPMGVFELPAYSKGTFAIAEVMGDETEANGMLTIIGGGDSASAAELSGQAPRMSHVSTGGGASLELLEGKDLPGITVLDDA
jgi:phosphoglycerate kinase